MNFRSRYAAHIIAKFTAPERKVIGGRDMALSRSNLHAACGREADPAPWKVVKVRCGKDADAALDLPFRGQSQKSGARMS